MDPLGRGVHRRHARRDPPTPRTRRQRRLRPAPGSDPQPHQRDHAALPTEPLPPNTTAAATSSAGRHEQHINERDSQPQADREGSRAQIQDPVRASEHPQTKRDAIGERHSSSESGPRPTADLPDVAWITARDGSRAPGDLEDQAARYHAGRHELTINGDFRAITDLMTHWEYLYKGIPGARAVIEAHVREWWSRSSSRSSSPPAPRPGAPSN